MDLTLTEEQEMIQSTARELLRSRAQAAGVRAVRGRELGYSAELWKEMVQLGWHGLAVPEVYGGVGEGFLELCLLIEEMGAAQVPSPFLSTVACVAPAIGRFGDEAQRARWLGAIATGRVVSHVRAAPRGHWGSTGSQVVATETGGGFTLDGVAMFVPYAAAADDLLVTARVGEDANQLATFLLDAASPGITVEPQDVIGPDRRHRVRFADVRTSEAELLGEIGGGQAIVETIDNYGAAATCAEMIGGAQRVLELTVEYAGQRVQFGRPIGSFQAVAHHCADMAADVLGSRFIGYEAIWRLSEALDPPAEISLAVSAAKAWVSDAYQRVCALGQQVHGAIGFTEEHDLHLFLSHAMAAALSFGDGDFHTDRVAGAIGLPTDQAPAHEPGGVD